MALFLGLVAAVIWGLVEAVWGLVEGFMGASGGVFGDKYPWLMHTIYADSGG